MRAAILDQYGPPSHLHTESIPRPGVEQGQVLIEVHAAGVNPIDYRIRQGQLRWILPARFPLVPGFDVAGKVVAVGSEVREEHLQPGSSVMAFLKSRHGGGYAEFVSADQQVVVRKPDELSMVEAAAIPLAGSTALQSLRDLGHVRQGSRVLINGASGGVGHLAVQIAKHLGAEVTGVCSESNAEFVTQLGADRVINYQTTDFTEQEATYNVVFDAVAKSSWWKSRRVLDAKGVYITTVPQPAALMLHAVSWFGRKCRVVLAKPNREDLEALAEMVRQHKLRPEIQETFPLERSAEAHQVSEEHHVRGKLVIRLDHP